MQDPYPAGKPFPPPVVALSALAAGFTLEHYRPAPLGLESAGFVAGTLVVGGSVLLAVWAVLTFRRAGTSVDFRKDTLQLVIAGPFNFTRNPMYLGMALLLLGLALLRDSGWFLATGAALVAILDRFTIRREEELLVSLFGDAYERYRERVRRWL